MSALSIQLRLCVAGMLLLASLLHAQEPRRPLVESIQDKVVQGEVKGEKTYYRNGYRAYEAFFWSKIAGWMVEDAINRRPAELKEHFNILDLGCGFGTLLVFSTIIYGAPGTCVDLASTLYPNVSEAYDVSFIKGDIEAGELPVLANTQVMIMTEVLEHFNFAPVPILRKIGDLLAPGGSFFLSTPDADGRWGRTYKYHRALNDFPAFDGGRKRVDDHLWHYNEGELRAVLTQAGFKIKRLDRTMNRGFTHFNVWATK